MKLDEYLKFTESYNYIPIYERIPADLLTPALAFLRLRDKNSFLLESVESEEKIGRYSFIGINPSEVYYLKNNRIYKNNEEVREPNIFKFIKKILNSYRQPNLSELPSFKGGLVGYIGYEAINTIEPCVIFNYEMPRYPIVYLAKYDDIIAFDHFKRELIIIVNAELKKDTDPLEAYSIALNKIKKIKHTLKSSRLIISEFKSNYKTQENLSKDDFENLVKLSKKDIAAGEIFQIVLSKKFYKEYSGDLFNVYRALRMINPSPYMFFIETSDGLTTLGASPENLTKALNGKVETMPIAGTRKRGKTSEQDLELERELANDEKERAEHIMLVDLGRNDLGRVCEYGTVKVYEFMKIYKYSHVMHMISRVEGKLQKDKDCVDALMSCFPAGTVTGAPKIRAMQLIAGYEKTHRGIYAGAIGYFDFSGNMDFCIAIRTFIAYDNLLQWQAGAGIVADSFPDLEHKEILNKAAALEQAVNFAEKIYEDFND